jgi:hypothetical protein
VGENHLDALHSNRSIAIRVLYVPLGLSE